jgi:hypothetical protein
VELTAAALCAPAERWKADVTFRPANPLLERIDASWNQFSEPKRLGSGSAS